MNFSDYSEFALFLEAQQLAGYRMCRSRGTKYIKGGTVGVQHYVCVVEGESRACSGKKRHISKLGSGSCDASFMARYSIGSNKNPCGHVALIKVQLKHDHDPVFKAQDVPLSTRDYIEKELERGVVPEKVALRLQGATLKAENREAEIINRITFLDKSYFKAYKRRLFAKEIELDRDEHCSVSLNVQERWQDSTLYHHPLGTDADAILVVIDHQGHGYPAAWMVTNRKNTTIQSHFLNVLHDAVPLFDPGVFMVDEDAVARNAVRTVFNGTRVYFCDFHLWRAWKNKLSDLKIEVTPEMEKHLCTLRQSAHKEDFDSSLGFFKAHFANTVSGGKFWDCLSHNYMHDKAQYWVGYLRFFPHATNNHAESWQNQLKSNYLRRKSKMRLDQYTLQPMLHSNAHPSLVHCLVKAVEPDIYQKHLIATNLSLAELSSVPALSGTVEGAARCPQGILSLPREELSLLLVQPATLFYLNSDRKLYEMLMQARHCIKKNEGPAKKLSKQ